MFNNRSSDDLEEMLSTETDPNKLKQIEAEMLRRGEEEDNRLVERWGLNDE